MFTTCDPSYISIMKKKVKTCKRKNQKKCQTGTNVVMTRAYTAAAVKNAEKDTISLDIDLLSVILKV